MSSAGGYCSEGAWPGDPRTLHHQSKADCFVDERHVARLVKLAEQILGDTPLHRFGSKGLMLCYRNDTPIRKITVAAKGAKVELLGTGQQFVAFGLHPDTGAPYRWLGETDFDEVATPLIVPVDVLLAVTPDQLRDFATKAGALLAELGYETSLSTGDMGERDASANASKGSPVSISVLRSAFAYRDASGPRDEWRNDVAAIRAANIPNDEHLSVRRQIAHDYSLGRLDRTGRFKDASPKNYSGPEAVDLVFDTMPPREVGIGVGWVFEEARKAGWQGNPFSDGKTAIEALAKPAGHLPDANANIPAASRNPTFPDVNQYGMPKTTPEKMRLALRALNLDCRHDVFHGKLLVQGHHLAQWSGEVSDHGCLMLRTIVRNGFNFEPTTKMMEDAVKQLCLQHRFAPICDYLDGLKWDGIKRLDTWLTSYLGAADTPHQGHRPTVFNRSGAQGAPARMQIRSDHRA